MRHVNILTYRGPAGLGVALWLKADDADKTHDDLVAAGVAIVRPPSDSPFGRMFAFRDLDGYVVTVHGG